MLLLTYAVTSRVFAKSHLLSPKELKHNLYLTEYVLGKTVFWHES